MTFVLSTHPIYPDNIEPYFVEDSRSLNHIIKMSKLYKTIRKHLIGLFYSSMYSFN